MEKAKRATSNLTSFQVVQNVVKIILLKIRYKIKGSIINQIVIISKNQKTSQFKKFMDIENAMYWIKWECLIKWGSNVLPCMISVGRGVLNTVHLTPGYAATISWGLNHVTWSLPGHPKPLLGSPRSRAVQSSPYTDLLHGLKLSSTKFVLSFLREWRHVTCHVMSHRVTCHHASWSEGRWRS